MRLAPHKSSFASPEEMVEFLCNQLDCYKSPKPKEDPMSQRYVNFTERARNVMRFANDEASRHDHDTVGPCSLLAGMLIEGSGVAAHALHKYTNLDLVRRAMETLEPDGKNAPCPSITPFGPAVKMIVDCYVPKEVEALKHQHTGTEHLLLGFLTAASHLVSVRLVLEALKLNQVQLAADVMAMLGNDGDEKEDGDWKKKVADHLYPDTPSTVVHVKKDGDNYVFRHDDSSRVLTGNLYMDEEIRRRMDAAKCVPEVQAKSIEQLIGDLKSLKTTRVELLRMTDLAERQVHDLQQKLAASSRAIGQVRKEIEVTVEAAATPDEPTAV